ncbi:putative protein phosphatase 2C-like protein 44 [Mangifera indica]|uniref:putative protein phosphatase 2C-like protein 44 n=1 Tax=Mangifera indica TaxID=29780 RepID=UPI001CFA9C45|nr:putative protein phosphatase 2C-like protein 44 [Mangifera indica]
MGLGDLYLKLKAFRLRRGGGGRKKTEKKAFWWVPVYHGFHVVVDGESDCDSVVVQREQFGETELWFFGVFDAEVGDGVTKYMQSHFFNKNLKEFQIRRKSKETMRKAYLRARAKVREAHKKDETWKVGSASVMVINVKKLVIANMGDYKVVVCRDGVAHQIDNGHLQTSRRHWTRRLLSAVRILACKAGNAVAVKQSRGAEISVGAEKMDSDTEFVIIASIGIWEVMKNQEAVNLIRNIDDPQEAAKCLATEALTRMSRSNISCLVIRFD